MSWKADPYWKEVDEEEEETHIFDISAMEIYKWLWKECGEYLQKTITITKNSMSIQAKSAEGFGWYPKMRWKREKGCIYIYTEYIYILIYMRTFELELRKKKA